jgi:hypothetical protein
LWSTKSCRQEKYRNYGVYSKKGKTIDGRLCAFGRLDFSCPAIAPGLLGILETKNQTKRRISMIAKFRKSNRWPILASLMASVLAVLTLTDARSAQSGGAAGSETAPSDSGAPPRIVASSPRSGDTDVNPALTEITVTFDRDMGGGFSWTGGGASCQSASCLRIFIA